MERNRGGRPRHPDILTPAEWRVLDALREGGTNAEIAAHLGISPDAVKYHISNMLGKLELLDRRALAAWRPEERRGRLPAWFAVPAAFAAIARPVAWVGIGTAAAAGVTVAVVAAVVAVVVVLVGVPGDGEPSAGALPPVVTPEGTSTPAPTPWPTVAVTPYADCDGIARADRHARTGSHTHSCIDADARPHSGIHTDAHHLLQHPHRRPHLLQHRRRRPHLLQHRRRRLHLLQHRRRRPHLLQHRRRRLHLLQHRHRRPHLLQHRRRRPHLLQHRRRRLHLLQHRRRRPHPLRNQPLRLPPGQYQL